MNKIELFFIITLVFFYTCNNNQISTTRYTGPKVTEAHGYIVPKDSMTEPTVILVDEKKLNKIPVGKPKVVSISTNIHPAGKPKSVVAGKPRVCTPGQDTFLLPKIVLAIDSPFMAGTPEVVIAKDAYYKDQSLYNFGSFTKQHGLKHTFTRGLMEDREGNLWFGMASNGVSKFDGKHFTFFTENQGLVSNNILCIHEDKAGNIWLGSPEGISKYDGIRFTNFTSRVGLINFNVNNIIEDKSGNIWIGTFDEGVIKYEPPKDGQGSSFTNFTTAQGLAGNVVYGMAEDKAGNLWFGTFDGVSKYDGKSFSNFTIAQGLGSDFVISIIEDNIGNLWFGTDNGVSKFNGKTFVNFTQKEGLISNIVWSMMEDRLGNLWIGSNNGGMCKFDGMTFTHFTEKEGFNSSAVHNIIEDRSGSLWFTSAIGGVIKYDAGTFTNFAEKETMIHDWVSGIVEDNAGNIWFSNNRKGVSKYDGKSLTLFTDNEGLSHNMVRSILQDKSGNMWFGTAAGGSKYDGKIFTHFTSNEGLIGYYITCITEDRTGNIWFGTGFGVSKYDGKFFTNFTTAQGLASDIVLDITEDNEGNIWFYSGGSISKYDGNNFTQFILNDKKNDVYGCSLKDRFGNIWFGSESEGLLKYDGKSFTHFTVKEGLISNVILSLSEDKKGNLWIGTRYGLSKLTPSKMAEINEKTKSGDFKEGDIFFKNYSYDDGFLGIGTNPGKLICEDKNGNIWIGANEKITVYHPQMEIEDTIAPNIQITGLELFNENIPWIDLLKNKDSTVTLANGVLVKNYKFDSLTRWYGLPQRVSLAHNNNNLTFNFIGITVFHPKKVMYQFKLDGIDENWSGITNKNSAPYGNLPPGTYTFKVKAMNSDGYWSEPIEYIFTIRPPWWRTWWAYILYTLAFAFTLSTYIQYRSRKLKEENIQLEEKVTHRTNELEKKSNELEKSLKDLKSTQAQLIQSEKMASLGELTAGIAHEIQNPLNFVNNFSELSVDLSKELKEEVEKTEIDKALIIDLATDLSQNQEKINYHGKRASDIVKGMLEHSRTSTGQKESTDVNALCDEYLRLAYHGLRAKDKSFNATMETQFDPNLPKVDMIPQDIGRVILNLINNAFYAVNEKANLLNLEKQSRDVNLTNLAYKPTISITTQLTANGQLQIAIKDNGYGIPAHIKEKIFQPFFTTKPTGQGTGLGLSLAYDIVKAHGGELKVESKEDEGSEFMIVLPLT